jgi:DNA-binding SARP family transcriptional activator
MILNASQTLSSRVHINLHGYPALFVDDRRVPLKLKHALALLAVMSLARGALGRAHLASLLWSDGCASALRARLRRLVHEARQLAGLPLFVGDADTLMLHEDCGSDLQRTRIAIAQLDAALGSRAASQACAVPGQPTDEVTEDSLVALARPLFAPEAADLLQGFTLGSEAFDAWVDHERRTHLAKLTRTLERLVERALSLQAVDLAEQTAMALLRLDPCNENAFRARMATRAANGDAAGVESVYFDAARVLREELGLTPSVGLEVAYAGARTTLEALHLARPELFDRLAA